MAWCPFYLGKSMCGASDSGLYVPPKDIEFKYCTGKFSKCKRYREVEGHSAADKADGRQSTAKQGKDRGRPA